MVAEVLRQQLLVLPVVLPDIRHGMAMGIVLWGLGVSCQVLQVVFGCSRSIVLISDGGIL